MSWAKIIGRNKNVYCDKKSAKQNNLSWDIKWSTKGEFSAGYTRLIYCLHKYCHPYFHWYFYQNTSVYALGRPKSNLDIDTPLNSLFNLSNQRIVSFIDEKLTDMT